MLLIGGWTLAASTQPAGYDPVRDTISALAARGATDRWIMTTALVGLGICHVVTAAGLRPARAVGRAVLVIGGAATLGVAAFPQPARGNSVAHTIAAAVAFAALATWPILASGRRPDLVLLRRGPSLAATLTMIALVLWFVAEVHGNERGLAERAAAGAQSLWPLCVVVTARARQRRRGRMAPGGL